MAFLMISIKRKFGLIQLYKWIPRKRILIEIQVIYILIYKVKRISGFGFSVFILRL